jgi:hypothetical protein
MRHIRTLIGFLPVVIMIATGCGAELDETLAEEEVLPADIRANDGSKLTGAHYNLNIIGVPQGKIADMTGDNGHRIFVPRFGSAKIGLKEGPFNVLDANGTDGNGATFQLPNPDPDGDGTTTYSVFARALGKPGGSSSMTTCFTDALDATYCSIYSSVVVRGTGKSSFENVSKQLLYAYVDTNLDGTLERYSIFSDPLAEYYWQYDNSGLHLLQLRFYEQIQTTVPAAPTPEPLPVQ